MFKSQSSGKKMYEPTSRVWNNKLMLPPIYLFNYPFYIVSIYLNLSITFFLLYFFTIILHFLYSSYSIHIVCPSVHNKGKFDFHGKIVIFLDTLFKRTFIYPVWNLLVSSDWCLFYKRHYLFFTNFIFFSFWSCSTYGHSYPVFIK